MVLDRELARVADEGGVEAHRRVAGEGEAQLGRSAGLTTTALAAACGVDQVDGPEACVGDVVVHHDQFPRPLGGLGERAEVVDRS